MSSNNASDKFSLWVGRVEALIQQFSDLLPDHVPLVDQISEELLTAIEELRVTDEELRQQYEELLWAHDVAAAERQRYHDLFHLAPDAYLVTDLLGMIREASQAAAALLKRDAAWLVGKPLANFIPLEERRHFREQLIHVARENRLFRWDAHLRVKPSAAAIDVSLTVTQMRDLRTEEASLNWLIRDISERKRAEAARQQAHDELELQVQERTAELVNANALLEMMVESAKDYAILALDLENRITSWNAGAERLFGYTEAEILGENGAILFVPEDRAAGAVEDELATARETGSASDERWKIRKDGSRFFASGMTRLMLDADGLMRGYVKVARDVTQRIQMQQIMREAQEHALTLAALEERQRLARELHDVVSQTLYSASVIAETLPRLWTDAPAPISEYLDELSRLNRSTLAELRMLLLELHPASLLKTDLGELLRQLVTATQARKRLNITVTADEGAPLPDVVQVAFYRIAQEAFNNIVKHANAANVTVQLQRQDAGVDLVIQDDGRGFDPVKRQGGLGLDLMRERADDIQAALTIESAPRKGTTVHLTWAPVEGNPTP